MTATDVRPRILPAPGMLTDQGRVLSVAEGRAMVWSPGAGVNEVAAAGLAADLTDRATYLLALEEVARRTGLDPADGFIFYLSDDSPHGGSAWILEGREEVRTRDPDTTDPVESLRRALDETAPAPSE